MAYCFVRQPMAARDQARWFSRHCP